MVEFNLTKLDPFFVGFDRMFHTLDEQVNRGYNVPSYPPYNIIKLDELRHVIEVAVAGFTKDDIDITLQEGKLSIVGEHNQNINEDNIVYKGIAERNFERSFTLAETVVVKSAELENGVLKVYLENKLPEEKKPKKIDILVK